MILLTGATGFVGSAVAEALHREGMPLAALVRETSATGRLRSLGIPLRMGDVTDPQSIYDALEGVSTVIHTAALVSFQPEDRDQMLKINGEGTANVVNMALERGVRRLIHLSSVAALDRVDGGPVVTLADRWPQQRPRTTYAESKAAAEREVWRGQAEGLEVSVLYPSLVLGVGDFTGDNTPALWRMAARGRGFYPQGTTGVVAREDVVRAVLFVLEQDEDGLRLLLNAENLSWREFMTAIAESIGAKPPSRAVPAWQSALLWPVDGLRARLAGKRPLITRESHRNVQARYAYDGSSYVATTGQDYTNVRALIGTIGQRFRKETEKQNK